MEVDSRGEETQVELAEEQADAQGQHQADEEVLTGTDSGAEDFQALLAKQDARIKELEGQVAEAAQTKANADKLTAEIEQLKTQAADERVEFRLKLAGVRNVKAAKALLGDHDGNVGTLKKAEPWLFSDVKPAATTGTTGLEPAGVAKDKDATMKRWRRLAGLDESDNE
ncbi:hypothetical protein HMPREF1008_00886 [Olsenella sp. oral taxon 809 str. F0356]|uniref:hypothetical protein n=1 Tax=Olsenella sp. oral taxon 809 TaxID=661086 RepID=UPI000231ED0B|nr:hypothetical protein [Olsenella sp. oral taxon 809]EHF02180.1 hypothetical protein HMPREF1008_00886 [Olsenella sp. oral taxon 809 str. F0356]